MGGDLKKIQTVGEYFVEVWKAVGMEGLNEKVRPFCDSLSELQSKRNHISVRSAKY